MATKLNIVFGERYGDVNDPKTRWSRTGAIFVKSDANAEDVEALIRLVNDKKLNLRIDSIPTSKQFDGWMSVFTPKDNEASTGVTDPLEGATNVEEPIDLSEVPF